MVELLEEALAKADALLARAPYEDVQAALTACASLPGAEAVMPGIAQRRLAATWLYNRSDEEVARELAALLEVETTLLYRASSTIAACTDRPNLASVYIPPFIAEIEPLPHWVTRSRRRWNLPAACFHQHDRCRRSFARHPMEPA